MYIPSLCPPSQHRRRTAWCATTVVLLTCPFLALPITMAEPITFTNSTTQLVVYGGESNNGLIPSGGYFDYIDLATSEITTWSIDPMLILPNGETTVLSNGQAGGFGSPQQVGQTARSTAKVVDIDIQADTELVGGIARTIFEFSSVSPMDGTWFVFHAENDLLDFGDDAALFLGSIANGDLQLYQYDFDGGDFYVRLDGNGVQNATLAAFGAGVFSEWNSLLESGDVDVLSSDGSLFATEGDLGMALGFKLTGNQARLVVNYQSVVQLPEPGTGGILCGALSLLCASVRRRICVSVRSINGN